MDSIIKTVPSQMWDMGQMGQSINANYGETVPTVPNSGQTSHRPGESVPTVPLSHVGHGTLVKSILYVEVSIWPNYYTSDAPKTVNLLTWLTSAKHRAKVEQIRALPTKAERDAIKATLPAITVSGLFRERRTKATLARHSGLIALDFDEKDNRHIANFTELRAQLCKIPSVAYCGLSVSGTGFYAIIPIVHPERHEQHFDALKRLFWQRWRLVADASCRDVSRLRGYSFDAAGFFRHDATPLAVFDEPIPPKPKTFTVSNDTDKTRRDILPALLRSVQAAPDGQRHTTLLKVATAIGGYIATGRIEEQTAVYGLETVASEWPNFSKSQKTIRDGIRYGLTKPIHDSAPTPVSKSLESVSSHPAPTVSAITATPQVVTTLADLQPGTVLRPHESQIERLTVDSCTDYPIINDVLITDFDSLTVDSCPDYPPGTVPQLTQRPVSEWLAESQTAPVVFPEIRKNAFTENSVNPAPAYEVAETQHPAKFHLREYACSFHDWQCQHKYFSQMGISSLNITDYQVINQNIKPP